MKLIKPFEITVSNTVTSIPIDDADVWTSEATYSLGNKVYKGIVLYESLIDGENTGNDPETDNSELSETPSWLVLGKVNAWRMFDGKVGSYTEGAEPAESVPSSIAVDITFNEMINYVTFFGLDATNVHVELDDGEGAIWSTDLVLYDDPLVDMQEYYFKPLVQPIQDITSTLNLLAFAGTLTITITNTNRPAKCGLCIPGRGIEIGAARYGISTGILSYSKKITDDFGRTYLAKGKNAKLMSVSLFIDNAQYSLVQQTLAAFDGEAVVWNANQADTDQSSFVIYGFSRDFRLVMDGPSISECSLELEGLI